MLVKLIIEESPGSKGEWIRIRVYPGTGLKKEEGILDVPREWLRKQDVLPGGSVLVAERHIDEPQWEFVDEDIEIFFRSK